MLSIEKSIITKTYNNLAKDVLRSARFGFIALLGVSLPAQALSLEEQRTRYEKAIAAIERNDMATFSTLKSGLNGYPLYPYLDYREFMRELSSAKEQEVEAFVGRYDELPFTNTVRARYLNVLASRGKWSELLAFQTTVPRGESHQCQYYYAHSQAGDKALALSGAKSLYLSGSSVDRACDKLFEDLQDKGKLNNALVLDRMLLAFDNRNKTLLKYLEKQLTGNAAASGQQIIALYDKPQGVAEFAKKSKVTPFNQRLTRLSFERLARINAKDAVAQFTRVVDGQHYKKNERQEMADFLASRLMSTDDDTLAKWRDKWLKQSTNPSLLERRIRVSLVKGDWKNVERWLNVLPEKEAKKLKWRYWHARIEQEKGNKAQAEKLFADMIGERNFYSVAAAMHLDKPIDIPFQTTSLNIESIKPFRAALDRVGELLVLDKVVAAKREWQYLLRRADLEQKAMLAAFASESKWYHLSVQATIAGKLWGHLEYRFPVAHRWWFEFFSKEREVPLTTLLALSRQESAFYTNAVSPVGARGLMQLMPATAKETSQKLGFRYLGKSTLSDPGINIRLGSGYLRMLLDRFDENRILAFAAYNAGPHRVSRWLDKSDGNLDAIAFIEAIPFNETRGYVQNVLMYDIYYRKLLGKQIQFLHESEQSRRY
ncbi:lytic transglycosylase [Enterovibrio norvegicus FF-162]|uniref:murein transglycosylase n=1 Tax=Enterovibrio norvegicus TaxID=188144 RepID=UPI000313C93F|nr:murein transglycosylase [Enterovibrio norvegicus]OEE74131.1 lytic transglycosylase [Enterovibrio norvegicus FF-162]